ncbi:hypothetical protein SAMN05660284_01522 [Formivibrio citricus]|uniref:Uncharacterized protein n=1 Tax=Formivibrio citricus TaxID=83765 RepID=A0A1I4Z4C6_9NEIS|nr:hypothetical protein [Formivibrio citricus]SFN45102.1 hypothetical protein SAMN05660284_01522 [Formivibrio citricus]
MHLILGVVVAVFLLAAFKSTDDYTIKKILKRIGMALALGIVLIPILVWGAIRLGPFVLLVLAIFLALRWLMSPSKELSPQAESSVRDEPPAPDVISQEACATKSFTPTACVTAPRRSRRRRMRSSCRV